MSTPAYAASVEATVYASVVDTATITQNDDGSITAPTEAVCVTDDNGTVCNF